MAAEEQSGQQMIQIPAPTWSLLVTEVQQVGARQLQLAARIDEVIVTESASKGRRDYARALIPLIAISIALATTSIGLNITTLIIVVEHLTGH